MPAMNATTILLVDDSPEDRHACISFLQASRDSLYTFLEADNAEDGLRICRQTHLDCIILDFELPDMSGLDFLARLTQDRVEGRPPVIMVTGRGSETVAVAALKAGASDYLIKSSISAQSVYRATRNALEISQLNRSLVQEMQDREGAEADLRESESRYRLLVESVQDYAIMMLDLDGRITSWNAGARKLFGYHDDEVRNQHVRRLYPAQTESSQGADIELRDACNRGCHSSDGYLVRKDGTVFWGTGSVSSVHDRSGRLRGFSKVVRGVGQEEGAGRAAKYDALQLTTQLRQEALMPLKQLQNRLDKYVGKDAESPDQWRQMVDSVVARVEKLCR